MASGYSLAAAQSLQLFPYRGVRYTEGSGPGGPGVWYGSM